MSDWSATESTNAANEGLDMSMPGDITLGSGNSYFGANLTDAVNDGNVSMSRLDVCQTTRLRDLLLMSTKRRHHCRTWPSALLLRGI